jgi:hypothetical protein
VTITQRISKRRFIVEPHTGNVRPQSQTQVRSLVIYATMDCTSRIKILWWDGTGLCLYAKRLERGRFVWPLTREGAAVLTPAQLSMLCEGIDWRVPIRTDAPGEVPACAG